MFYFCILSFFLQVIGPSEGKIYEYMYIFTFLRRILCRKCTRKLKTKNGAKTRYQVNFFGKKLGISWLDHRFIFSFFFLISPTPKKVKIYCAPPYCIKLETALEMGSTAKVDDILNCCFCHFNYDLNWYCYFDCDFNCNYDHNFGFDFDLDFNMKGWYRIEDNRFSFDGDGIRFGLLSWIRVINCTIHVWKL